MKESIIGGVVVGAIVSSVCSLIPEVNTVEGIFFGAAGGMSVGALVVNVYANKNAKAHEKIGSIVEASAILGFIVSVFFSFIVSSEITGVIDNRLISIAIGGAISGAIGAGIPGAAGGIAFDNAIELTKDNN